MGNESAHNDGVRVLVVEDDEELGAQVVQHLRRAGYVPNWLRDGSLALEERWDEYGLVLLDLLLPGTFGLDVLARLRAESTVPVLILSARDQTADKVRAFGLGADDYVTKPFWPEELLARVAARLRRPMLLVSGALRFGALEVEVDARRVLLEGKELELTPTEFALLRALVSRVGQALTRSSLVERALEEGTERTLDVHVMRLRKKLGGEGKRIATVWGIGYRFDGGA